MVAVVECKMREKVGVERIDTPNKLAVSKRCDTVGIRFHTFKPDILEEFYLYMHIERDAGG